MPGATGGRRGRAWGSPRKPALPGQEFGTGPTAVSFLHGSKSGGRQGQGLRRWPPARSFLPGRHTSDTPYPAPLSGKQSFSFKFHSYSSFLSFPQTHTCTHSEFPTGFYSETCHLHWRPRMRKLPTTPSSAWEVRGPASCKEAEGAISHYASGLKVCEGKERAWESIPTAGCERAQRQTVWCPVKTHSVPSRSVTGTSQTLSCTSGPQAFPLPSLSPSLP